MFLNFSTSKNTYSRLVCKIKSIIVIPNVRAARSRKCVKFCGMRTVLLSMVVNFDLCLVSLVIYQYDRNYLRGEQCRPRPNSHQTALR